MQTITFLHTVLGLELKQLRTAAVVVPVNTLYNWEREVCVSHICARVIECACSCG